MDARTAEDYGAAAAAGSWKFPAKTEEDADLSRAQFIQKTRSDDVKVVTVRIY